MVSIIILSYNTEKLLRSCLMSIYSQLKKFDYETIVLDNASTDNSVAMVKREFEKVRLIESKENLGFAKACNQGIDASSARFILILNPDTLVPEDCFMWI